MRPAKLRAAAANINVCVNPKEFFDYPVNITIKAGA
jgi:hypothetical protein